MVEAEEAEVEVASIRIKINLDTTKIHVSNNLKTWVLCNNMAITNQRAT